MNRDEGLSFSQVSNDYLQYLRHERGCAKTTCVTYASWLHHYRDWLTKAGRESTSLTAFTLDILRSYQYALSRRGLRPRTIRAALQPLRGLGDFLVTHEFLTANTAKSLTMPKKDAAIRLTVSDEEIVALLDGASRLHPDRRCALSRAVISTFVHTGVRFQELLDLHVGDVDLSGKTLLVRSGKGGKTRTLYPPQECLTALADWLKERGEASHDWLWFENKGRRFGDIGIRGLLEECKAPAGLRGRENVKPHSLRHAFASRMLRNGASLKVIQSSLGHTDIKTSAIYLHMDEREAMNMAVYACIKPAHAPDAPNPTTHPQRPQKPAQYTRQRRESARR